MEYKEFLEYIYERHSGNVKLGLDRMLNILKEMGNPDQKLKGIHVAGTNGKGSTSAMCESIALRHGLKTGLNTSPHLVDYRERIRINEQDIKFEDILRIYNKWEDILQNNEASFFEITTALAFYYFLEQEVDTAIFEVGLGGRLDGTNPFNADVSVITSISIDHPKSLGDTIEKIAFEKAGIIKENQKVVIGNLPPEAVEVIKEICLQRKAELIQPEMDYAVSNIRTDLHGTIFDYSYDGIVLKDVRVSLLGEHQALNAGIAITAFIEYTRKHDIEENIVQIREGLEQVTWKGRMQILQKTPLVLLDGAHNEEGVFRLVDNLKKLFPDKKIIFVLAILRDKKIDKMIHSMCKIGDRFYISKNKSNRAAEIQDQVDIVKEAGLPYFVANNVQEAKDEAVANAASDDIIVVTGSLYTISEILNEG